MGGGDLNLKKSWHPSTLRNIERVWKAEQKHEVEKLKIEQLQKELAEERAREEIQTYAENQGVVKKKEERLEWMYQGPAAMVNRDDYLMGRKIDKTFELLQQQEKEVEAPKDEDERFGSMFSQTSSGNATVDLANKIREDPLFSIMKKEKEQRKSLLTNPVKMKQLQQILKMSLTDKKKSKKSKKHKKDKKRREHSSSCSDDEKSQKERKYYDISENRETSRKDKKRRDHSSSCSDAETPQKEKKFFYASESSEAKRKEYGLIVKDRSGDHYDKKSTKRQAVEDFERTHKTKRLDDSYSNHQKETNNFNSKYQKSDKSNHYNEKYYYYENHKKTSNHNSTDYHKKDNGTKKEAKKKLNAEERERLLREMQENAKWREEQRKRNTKRYQEEAEKEDNFQRVDSKDFLRPMLSKAAGKGSLENRVKQKVFTIQRNQSDMDKHFARR